MAAWNGWYHVMGNTYGTWLPGDPRGWRERKHKKHVAGDYKCPPPAGSGDEVLRRSKSLLTQPPVHLTVAQRKLVGQSLVEMLVRQESEVLALSLTAVHFHLLARFRDAQVRPLAGRAKKHAYFQLRDAGFAGTLWGDGTSVVPVEDRAHQVNVFNYIVDHRAENAWVWTFREGVYWQNTE
jgi:hypothetical protein